MKNLIVIAMISILASHAVGQDIRGGFGHAYFGLGCNISPGIQNDLSSAAVLGSNLQLNRPGFMGGGGGYGLVGKRILVGGSGVGFRVADATERGEATLSTGGGFINVGYVFPIREYVMTFPYFGLGGNGMELKVKNTMEEPFALGNTTIAPGEEVKLKASGISFEAGFGFKLMAFPMTEEGSHGGFMVGLQIGTYVFTGLENWQVDSSENMVPSLSTPYSFAPYVRLTIGGGGFKVVN